EGPMGLAGTNVTNGVDGATGPAGPQGLTGDPGPQGTIGDMGPVGITFRDAWAADATYVLNDVVTDSGSSYIALNGNTASEPNDVNPDWSLLAAAGTNGTNGTNGTPGATGATG